MQALLVKDEMKATLNAKIVVELIVELYTSTRSETTGDKVLGLRVYLVDKAWQFKSVLLGTRKFNPADSGGDVKAMLRTELDLHWEWCFAHMAHAATKASCGVNGTASAEANPAMANLISKIVRTIFQIKHVSTMGNLFEELCKSKTKGASTRLIEYSTSRFLSLTNAMERILLKWPAITAWYEERKQQELRANKTPTEFPLTNCHGDLVHVLSVLKQIGEIKRTCQAKRPVQVEVLVKLFLARIQDLNPDQPLRHYLSSDENPKWIAASDLTPLATNTRLLLREALDERFF
ncbi:hypothetical protein F442_02751 [Phytophthora nicotianae P10297]|uniref:Uncharacterized protein n=2 Tax=Phytophthora nicotianae P10297 TaxID=1317064 RepID=W2ZXX1_PHYNI|nr:hypothetical protein F442_02751 [Phytophthora nicotianae P10297]